LLLQMYSIILLHEVQLGLGAIAKLSGGVTQGGEQPCLCGGGGADPHPLLWQQASRQQEAAAATAEDT
jgi:hypothetical protein